jgi:hypothetical protein
VGEKHQRHSVYKAADIIVLSRHFADKDIKISKFYSVSLPGKEEAMIKINDESHALAPCLKSTV